MRLVVAVCLILAGLASTATAEPLSLLENEYKPVVNTKAGRIDLCGVHFSAILTTLDQRLLNVQGSVNTGYFPGKFPGLMIKVMAVEGRHNTLIPRKVHFAQMRIGTLDTSKMRQMLGEDANSILLVTSMQETGDFFVTFSGSFHQGAWLSISLDPSKSDYTFRLPPFEQKDAETLAQVSQCDQIALDALIGEAKKQ